jgi:hypothetical protein
LGIGARRFRARARARAHPQACQTNASKVVLIALCAHGFVASRAGRGGRRSAVKTTDTICSSARSITLEPSSVRAAAQSLAEPHFWHTLDGSLSTIDLCRDRPQPSVQALGARTSSDRLHCLQLIDKRCGNVSLC